MTLTGLRGQRQGTLKLQIAIAQESLQPQQVRKEETQYEYNPVIFIVFFDRRKHTQVQNRWKSLTVFKMTTYIQRENTKSDMLLQKCLR